MPAPRGDDGPVVGGMDDRTLLMPDWRGNNRMDCLRNIVRDGRVSPLILVAGSTTAIRVNGRAGLSTDPGLLAGFVCDWGGGLPKTVIVIAVAEV